jgi:hypothetical protein
VRILAVFAVAAVLVVDANASRSPTARERAAIVSAVSAQALRNNPLVIVRIDRILVSTIRPGPGAPFTRFASAVGFSRTTLLGYYPDSKRWFVKAYGSTRAVCRTSPYIFGGRRAAILRDLGIRCD